MPKQIHHVVRRKTRKEFALSRRKQEIIVIASLVDKVPNLAGLTRTCEIFGAKKLVIPSKKFQDDDLFSTISVTAEKWLNIEYVPELDLKDYLSLQINLLTARSSPQHTLI